MITYNSENLTPTDILNGAKKLLIENKWIKESFAKNSKGENVMSVSKDACQFCLAGAIERAAHYPNLTEDFNQRSNLMASRMLAIIATIIRLKVDLSKAGQYISDAYCMDVIALYNDKIAESKDEIIDMLDIAIDQFDGGMFSDVFI